MKDSFNRKGITMCCECICEEIKKGTKYDEQVAKMAKGLLGVLSPIPGAGGLLLCMLAFSKLC